MVIMIMAIVGNKNLEKNGQSQKVGIWLNLRKLISIRLQILDQVFELLMLKKSFNNYIELLSNY